MTLALAGVASAQEVPSDLLYRFTRSVAERMSLEDEPCPVTVLEMMIEEPDLIGLCFRHPFPDFPAFAQAWEGSAQWQGVVADHPDIRGWLDLTGDGSVLLRIFVFDSDQHGLDNRRYLVWASQQDDRLFVLYPE